MKKFFLFAAAAVAALSVNAKVVNFAGIVDKTDANTAKATFEAAFNVANLTVAGKPNSGNTAYYAELTQTSGTTEWGITSAKLKADAQVYFEFKDKNDNKVVMKYWADYAQPNGKAVALVISGLNRGDIVTINLKEALNKEVAIEGATVATDNFEDVAVQLTAAASEIRVFSQNADGSADAKWKLVSVEVPGGTGIEGVSATNAKAVKRIIDGQVVIERDGRFFNLLGAEMK